MYTLITILFISLDLLVDNIIHLVIDSNYEAICQVVASCFMLFHCSLIILIAALTNNLCCLAYKHVSLKGKKIECFYLICAFLLPLVVIWLPFLNHCYGSNGISCWIKTGIHSYVFILPVNISIVLVSLLIMFNCAVTFLTMMKQGFDIDIHVVVLDYSEFITEDMRKKYKKALKETLPLILVAFLISLSPIIVIYNAFQENEDKSLSALHKIFASCYGMIAGIMCVIHIILVRNFKKQKQTRTQHCITTVPSKVNHLETDGDTYVTTFPLLQEEDVEDNIQ